MSISWLKSHEILYRRLRSSLNWGRRGRIEQTSLGKSRAKRHLEKVEQNVIRKKSSKTSLGKCRAKIDKCILNVRHTKILTVRHERTRVLNAVLQNIIITSICNRFPPSSCCYNVINTHTFYQCENCQKWQKITGGGRVWGVNWTDTTYDTTIKPTMGHKICGAELRRKTGVVDSPVNSQNAFYWIYLFLSVRNKRHATIFIDRQIHRFFCRTN